MKRLMRIALLLAVGTVAGSVAASDVTPANSSSPIDVTGPAALVLDPLQSAGRQADCGGRGDVIPQANCTTEGGGAVTVWFGFTNCGTEVAELPIGERNRFFPGAKERGQPVSFKPGTSERVFGVALTTPFVVWILDETNLLARVIELKPCPAESGTEPPGE